MMALIPVCIQKVAYSHVLRRCSIFPPLIQQFYRDVRHFLCFPKSWLDLLSIGDHLTTTQNKYRVMTGVHKK